MTLTGTIPFDAKGIGAAAAASKPVILAAPRSAAGRAITTISAAIAKDSGDAKAKPQGGFTLANLLPFLAKDGGSKA
jgi:MinD-like ATPase involved in chromosome partitioning or flagellar assembly